MGILRSDPLEELAVIDEDDEFYEDMEAPKFVDFTDPDRSRPDDKSWFCLRIGCDQKHEEVDPDALYRSFMLRVMAARSPNVRFQKALSKQAPRSIKKCPHSAPAKSAKDRVSRLSTITSIQGKMAKAKLKNHPVSTLGSTPVSTKAKVQPTMSERKALTSPRAKKCPSNHEPFRSVKHQKAPVAVPKNRSVAKALFTGTPKKNIYATKLLYSEVCDGMKKLNIGTLKKHKSGGHICKAFSRCTACNPNCLEVSGNKGEEASSMSSKMRNEFRGAEISSISSDHSVVKTNVEENLPTSSVLIVQESQRSAKTDSTRSINSEEDPKENMIVLHASSEADTQTGNKDDIAESNDNKENDLSARYIHILPDSDIELLLPGATGKKKVTIMLCPKNNAAKSDNNHILRVMDNVAKSDDNKENDSGMRNVDSSTTISESERLQFETSENIPQKVIRVPRKKIQDHDTQAGKIKRTTNPKPFRLRTDERGILKEANLEKKIHLEALKETVPVPKHRDEKQQNAAHEKNHETTSNVGQKAQPKPTRTPRVRYIKSRYATGICKCQKPEYNESEESQKKLAKTASSSRQILKAQSVTAARKVQISQVREKGVLDNKTRAEDSKMTNSTRSKGKKPSAIPKVSTLQRLHAPKSFSR